MAKNNKNENVVKEEAQQEQKAVELKNMLATIRQWGLPQVATGGDLSNWKADLTTISKIEVSKEPLDGNKWIIIEGEGSTKIPSLQHRCLVALAVSSYQAPRTDRGYAYQTWLFQHKKQLREFFGDYSVRIWHEKATLPVTEYSVSDILALVEVHAPALVKSVEIEEPRRSTRTAGVKNEEEEVDFVL